jgi:UDP-N-acetylglucosamine 2-epimerase
MTKIFTNGTDRIVVADNATLAEFPGFTEEAPIIDLPLLALDARKERNLLLVETDHFALVDVTLSNDMRDYRQDLRDITDQSGFPTNITWPTKP